MTSIVDKTCEFVENKLAGDGSGHDWWHIFRVWTVAKKIAAEEKKKAEEEEKKQVMEEGYDKKVVKTYIKDEEVGGRKRILEGDDIVIETKKEK